LGAGISVFALACSFLFIALDSKAHKHEDRPSAPDVKVSAMGSNPLYRHTEALTLNQADLHAASLRQQQQMRMSLRSGRQSTVVVIKESKHFELGFWLLCFDGLLTYGMGTSAIVVGSAELIA